MGEEVWWFSLQRRRQNGSELRRRKMYNKIIPIDLFINKKKRTKALNLCKLLFFAFGLESREERKN